MLKEKGSVELKKKPDQELPDDRLFKEGKIKSLFNRVLGVEPYIDSSGNKEFRKKKKFNKEYKIYEDVPKEVANFNKMDLTPELSRLEEDCIAKYQTKDVEVFIVRYGTGVEYKKEPLLDPNGEPSLGSDGKPLTNFISREFTKFGVEVFKDDESVESYFVKDVHQLIDELKKEYPENDSPTETPSVGKKRGMPKGGWPKKEETETPTAA